MIPAERPPRRGGLPPARNSLRNQGIRIFTASLGAGKNSSVSRCRRQRRPPEPDHDPAPLTVFRVHRTLSTAAAFGVR